MDVVSTDKPKRSSICAVIGLGNPGMRFVKHRHNIGFRIVNALAESLHAQWSTNDLIEYARISLPTDFLEKETFLSADFFLIKPQTFMNNSDKALPFLLKKGIKPEEILVVHDELEKKFGHLSLRFGGSARGHNGLRAIIGAIGPHFWRLRFGIDRPEHKEDVADYVLSNFSREEEVALLGLVEKAVGMITGE